MKAFDNSGKGLSLLKKTLGKEFERNAFSSAATKQNVMISTFVKKFVKPAMFGLLADSFGNVWPFS